MFQTLAAQYRPDPHQKNQGTPHEEYLNDLMCEEFGTWYRKDDRHVGLIYMINPVFFNPELKDTPAHLIKSILKSNLLNVIYEDPSRKLFIYVNKIEGGELFSVRKYFKSMMDIFKYAKARNHYVLWQG